MIDNFLALLFFSLSLSFSIVIVHGLQSLKCTSKESSLVAATSCYKCTNRESWKRCWSKLNWSKLNQEQRHKGDYFTLSRRGEGDGEDGSRVPEREK